MLRWFATSALVAAAACSAVDNGAAPARATQPDPVAAVAPVELPAVDRLRFAFHGDTRPGRCDATAEYPSDVIGGIFRREAAAGAQFTVDLGDHMFVCNGSLDEARAQMATYLDAARALGAPLFMTMGNHECESGYCGPASTDANFTAFREALAPVSPLPYYSFDVRTGAGVATFVIVADNAWDDAERAWLEATLTRADRDAKYTIVARHHPVDNTEGRSAEIARLVAMHKTTLVLAGHTHAYHRDVEADPSGRSLRMGCAGAPILAGAFYGFGLVTQQPDDDLLVEIVDEASGAVRDAFMVSPQPGAPAVSVAKKRPTHAS